MLQRVLQTRLAGAVALVLCLLGFNWGLYRVIPAPVRPEVNYRFAARLDFTQLINGTGWQLPEVTSDGVHVAWTTEPTATLVLPLYIKADLRLQFLIHSAMPGIVDSLKVRIGQSPIAIQRQETPLGNIFTGLVPRQIVGMGKQTVVLTIETGPPVSPASFDNLSGDTRRLGLAFRALSLEPVTNATLIDFDGQERGRGWQRPETDSKKTTYQWMGIPEASVQLPPLDATDLALVFHVNAAMAPDILDSLTLAVNGRSTPVARLSASNLDGTVFQASIPKSAFGTRGESPRLSFRINRTVSPKALGAIDDDRPLGLAFDWLLVYPAQNVWMGMNMIPWGTGFGGIESDSGGDHFRWMNVPQATLDVPVLAHQATHLQFDAVYTITPETVRSLRVTANGQPLSLSYETLEEGNVFSTVIPPLDTDVAKLVFTIDKTSSPKQLGRGNDDRQLGIALKWISLLPDS